MVDGADRTSIVDTGIGARAGQTVTVWVDENGNYMQAPNTSTDNAIRAIGAALAVLALGTVGCGLLLIGTSNLVPRSELDGAARNASITS